MAGFATRGLYERARKDLVFTSISRAIGDRRSKIEKHVFISVRRNLPKNSSTVLSEPKSGPPQSKIPGSVLVHQLTSTTLNDLMNAPGIYSV